jgi:hypothetical protein
MNRFPFAFASECLCPQVFFRPWAKQDLSPHPQRGFKNN